MTDSAAPRTKRVVRTERRERPFKIGLWLAGVGVALFIAGMLLFTVLGAAEILGAVDRAAVGTPITFEAEDRTYAVVFIRGELDESNYRERAVANMRCDVTTADGASLTVDGSSQAVASETDFGSSVGTFDAVAGPTTVRCDFVRDPGGLLQNYAVAPERQGAKIASWVLLGLGALVTLVGVGFVITGVRGQSVIEHVAIGELPT